MPLNLDRNYATGGRCLVNEVDASVVIRWYSRSLMKLWGKKREEREVSVRLFLLTDMLLIVSPNIERASAEVLYRLERELPLCTISEVRVRVRVRVRARLSRDRASSCVSP